MKFLRADLIRYSPEYRLAIQAADDKLLMTIINSLVERYRLVIKGFYIHKKSINVLTDELDYAKGYIYRIKIEALEKIAMKCDGESYISRRLYQVIYLLDKSDWDNSKQISELVKKAYTLSKKEYLNTLKRG